MIGHNFPITRCQFNCNAVLVIRDIEQAIQRTVNAGQAVSFGNLVDGTKAHTGVLERFRKTVRIHNGSRTLSIILAKLRSWVLSSSDA